MKKAILLALALSFHTNFIQASTTDVLDSYKQTAEDLLTVLERSDDQTVETAAAHDLLDQLINEGTETMKIFAEKKPECAEQFAVFIEEIPSMMKMTVNDIHKRYHDGVGLPSAPKLCYFGRSQIVHPVMSKLLLKEWNAESREEVIDQTNEVIEHNERIRKLLAL